MPETIRRYGSVDITPLLHWEPKEFFISKARGRKHKVHGQVSNTGLFGIYSHREKAHDGRNTLFFTVTHRPTGLRCGTWRQEWMARGWANLQETAYKFWRSENIETRWHRDCAMWATATVTKIAGQGGGATQISAVLEDFYTKKFIASGDITMKDLLEEEQVIQDERELGEAAYKGAIVAPGGMIAVQDEEIESKPARLDGTAGEVGGAKGTVH